MNDQDKMFEEIQSPTSGEDAASPLEKEELQKRGAKIFACNERSRARIAEIAHLANECLLNTNHPTGYEPGQYGKDYRTYGKAMGEIRKLVKESIADVDPDYEMLALQFARKTFDFSKFKEALAAVASMKPTDFPGVYYTPGWLCELAKKLEGDSTVPSPSPATGADKAAKTAEYMRRKYSFCDGLFPIRRANCEKAVTEHCWIGGRRFTMELTQDIHDDGEHVCCAKIRDNGNLIARLAVYRGKSMAEHMAHATFKAYVKNLSGSNRLSSRGGFLKTAIKRALAARRELENGGRA